MRLHTFSQMTRCPKHYSNFDRTGLSSFDRTTTAVMSAPDPRILAEDLGGLFQLDIVAIVCSIQFNPRVSDQISGL